MQLPLPQVLTSHLDRAKVQSPKRVFPPLGMPSRGGGMQVPGRAWGRRAFRHQTAEYSRMPTRTGGLYFDEKNIKNYFY
jgi:hypothetical protein